MCKKFIVKCSSEEDARFVQNLAAEYGYKWMDDKRHDRNLRSGQTVKNLYARYIYFGFKGEGLMSHFNRVKKSVAPNDVYDVRKELHKIIQLMDGNKTLHVGADEIAFEDGSVKVECKTFDAEMVNNIAILANKIRDMKEQVNFYANGDIKVYDRKVSNYLINKISSLV